MKKKKIEKIIHLWKDVSFSRLSYTFFGVSLINNRMCRLKYVVGNSVVCKQKQKKKDPSVLTLNLCRMKCLPSFCRWKWMETLSSLIMELVLQSVAREYLPHAMSCSDNFSSLNSAWKCWRVEPLRSRPTTSSRTKEPQKFVWWNYLKRMIYDCRLCFLFVMTRDLTVKECLFAVAVEQKCFAGKPQRFNRLWPKQPNGLWLSPLWCFVHISSAA